MNWLNPFKGGDSNIIGKDNHGQAASNYPRQPQQTAQYAPHMPYTGVSPEYGAPPHPEYGAPPHPEYGAPPHPEYGAPPHPANLQNSYSGLAGWMSGRTCNPCNQEPWIPVLQDNAQGNHGQYAPNAPSNAYLAPPPPQEVKPQDYSHPGPAGTSSGNQQNYPIPNPHLYSGVVPPLYKAKPFNDAPVDYSAPIVNQPSPPNFNNQSPPPNFNHQPPPSNFDHQPLPSFDHQPPPSFEQPPSPNFNQHPPSNFDHPPSTGYDNSSPQIFDHPPSPNFNQLPLELDHPPTELDQQNYENHPPQNFNHQQSPSYDHSPSPNSNYQHSSNFDNQSPSNYEDHPSSNFEQHHQSSQIVDVVKEAPSNVDKNVVNQHQEPDHAESRPVFINSATSSSARDNDILEKTTTVPNIPKQSSINGAIIHFQRSPLIDLSVAGESSTNLPSETNNRLPDHRPPATVVTILPSKGNRETLTTPAATVIDYIVSSPDEASFYSSEEEKESRPTKPPSHQQKQHQSERNVVPLSVTTTSTTTTTQRTTTMKVDQRQQESLIETLVQSYEFYKKKNDTRPTDTKLGGRILLNDTDDFSSASREVVLPSKGDNGKKNKQIIQIIIPYTSQYTPSPFHPTRSIDGHVKKGERIHNNPSINNHKEETTTSLRNVEIDENIEDNVVIQESRRVSVTRDAPDKLRNNRTNSAAPGNAIDVHRLQKNIDNWTIQEYSKSATSVTSLPNSTYPRWLSSKTIPDEYLLSTTEVDESSEYYDFSNETEVHRGTNKEVTSKPESVTKVDIIEANYPKIRKKSTNKSSERVYVVTPIPNPNSLEDLSNEKDQLQKSKSRKGKQQNSVSVERAYQVLPQAVNNLAALNNAPESAAPALWGIMEHEEIAASADQPRWRSESDVLPEPASTPILYAGHSKVSRAR